MIAIRGAIRVERNDRDVIFRGTRRLLREIRERNGLEEDDVVSAFFTMTPDLNADFPAYAARETGWTETAMLGAQETAVPGAMDRMIRVLVHADTDGRARHVYLGEAAAMRPDLAEEGDAREAVGPSPPGTSARFGRLLVVGLGLIGGSAALALRRRGLFEEVRGHDVSDEALRQAARAGAVDEVATSPGDAVDRADVVLLAVPVDAVLEWLSTWGDRLRRGSVVIDVGSTKRRVVRAMGAGLPEGVEAVGAHPMAGSEESGMGAARPDLFYGARWALVETDRTGDRAREVAEAIVEAVDGRTLWTGAAAHDRATAATSHLPWMVSAALALHLDDRSDGLPVRELLGPGAKDMLRLAGSGTDVIADILATNWPEIRDEVDRFTRRLEALADRIAAAVGSAGADRDETGETGRAGHGREPRSTADLDGIVERVRAARTELLPSPSGSRGARPDAGRDGT
jgi:monofunctional chorismate mutase